MTGEDILYFSDAQLPRSVRRQRSLQKGNSAFVSESTGLRQMGQRNFTLHPKQTQASTRSGAPVAILRTGLSEAANSGATASTRTTRPTRS